MSKYPNAKMPDYGDGPEPCEDCAILNKRIAELEGLLRDVYEDGHTKLMKNEVYRSWCDHVGKALSEGGGDD